MTWEQYLEKLRSGENQIPTVESGLPVFATNAPIYELMQMVQAMTEGYNRNVRKVNMMKKVVQANFKKEGKK